MANEPQHPRPPPDLPGESVEAADMETVNYSGRDSLALAVEAEDQHVEDEERRTVSFAMAVLMRKAQKNAKWMIEEDKQETPRTFTNAPMPKALFCLTLKNPLRRCVRAIVLKKAFDWCIMLVIATNCIFLLLDDNPPPESLKGQMIAYSENIFNGIFVTELTLKVIAMGFWGHPNSYLRDPWNRLDFVVVVLGLVGLINGVSNFSVVRTVRVARPLRAIKSVPGMRVIILSLLSSIPYLIDVMGLFIFLIFIFGILAVQLWGGQLRQNCMEPLTGKFEEFTWQPHALCSLSPSFGRQCPNGMICVVGFDNPMAGIISFDNIILAFLTIFQMITLEGWTDDMYWVEETDSIWCELYFVVLIGVGAFFVVNLVVAVIFLRFDQMKTQISNEKAEKQRRKDEEEKVAAVEALEAEAAVNAAANVSGSPPDPTQQDHHEDVTDELEGQHFHIVYDKVVHDKDLTKFQRYVIIPCSKICESNKFSGAIIGAILLNTMCLAIDYPDIPEETTAALEIGNKVLWAVFFCEAAIRLLGQGYKAYFKDGFNKFDFFIVFMSTVEMAQASGSSLSVLRTFRLLRVLKVLAISPNLKILMQVVLLSLDDIFNFLLVFVLFWVIFATLGMQLFQGKMTDFSATRAHFNDLWWSFVTVFQIVTAENWNLVLYSAINGAGWAATCYFIPVFVICNYVLLSLFLAILLGNFDALEKIKLEVETKPKVVIKNGRRMTIRVEIGDLKVKRVLQQELDTRAEADMADTGLTTLLSKIRKFDEALCYNLSVESHKVHPVNRGVLDNMNSSRHAVSEKKKEREEMMEMFLYGKSLGILEPENWFRRRAALLALSDAFEKFILLMILISNVLLAMDEPNVETESPLGVFLFQADVCMTAIFIFEMCLKIIGFGFAFCKNSYLHTNWNVLDFVIVVFSVVSLCVGGTGFKLVKAFRSLRSLRALRMVSHMKSLRLVVKSITATFNSLVYVVIIALLFFTIFAILGVQLFKGGMWRCQDVGTGLIMYGVNNAADCAMLSRDTYTWMNGYWNMDNVFSALLVLFEVSTLEMWPDIMYQFVDRVGEGYGPVQNTNPAAALYFMVFIVIGSFFVIGLFVGVVVDEYNKQHLRFTGALKLSVEQKYYLEAYKHMVYNPPPIQSIPSKHSIIRKRIFTLVQAGKFEGFIMTCILLNILVMSFTYYGEPAAYTEVLKIINETFTFIFLGEMVLKLIALGLVQYSQSRWNLFDCFIVITSMITLALDYMGSTSAIGLDPSTFRIFRIFRVLRIFRLVRRAKGLKQLIQTLIFSAPALSNVGTLLLLLFFMYAIIAMNQYGQIPNGIFINDHANFRSFRCSMMTLFRMSTGENWNGIMRELEASPQIQIVDRVILFIYFVSFTVFSSFLLLNLIVAVVLKNFEEEVMSDSKNTSCPITRDHIIKFGQLWQEHHNGNLMPVVRLQGFLMSLPPGWILSLPHRQVCGLSRYLKLLDRLDIPQYKLHIHFLDVILAIATYKLFPAAQVLTAKIECENEMLQGTKQQALRMFPELTKSLRYQFSAAHALGAIRMQSAWRSCLKLRIANGLVMQTKEKPQGFRNFLSKLVPGSKKRSSSSIGPNGRLSDQQKSSKKKSISTKTREELLVKKKRVPNQSGSNGDTKTDNNTSNVGQGTNVGKLVHLPSLQEREPPRLPQEQQPLLTSTSSSSKPMTLSNELPNMVNSPPAIPE